MTAKPSTRAERETWVMVLEDEPAGHDVPCEIRLRRALKTLLRRFGIRAVSIGPAPRPHQEQRPQHRHEQEREQQGQQEGEP